MGQSNGCCHKAGLGEVDCVPYRKPPWLEWQGWTKSGKNKYHLLNRILSVVWCTDGSPWVIMWLFFFLVLWMDLVCTKRWKFCQFLRKEHDSPKTLGWNGTMLAPVEGILKRRVTHEQYPQLRSGWINIPRYTCEHEQLEAEHGPLKKRTWTW